MNDVLIPVRCQSCNSVIGNKYETYCAFLEEEMQRHESSTFERDTQETLAERALRRVGVFRPCCRRHFLAQPTVTETPSHFPLKIHASHEDVNTFLNASTTKQFLTSLEYKKGKRGLWADAFPRCTTVCDDNI
jgi:DNA-directed RNA polymerase subunit N (RpoN/RPB10)